MMFKKIRKEKAELNRKDRLAKQSIEQMSKEDAREVLKIALRERLIMQYDEELKGLRRG